MKSSVSVVLLESWDSKKYQGARVGDQLVAEAPKINTFERRSGVIGGSRLMGFILRSSKEQPQHSIARFAGHILDNNQTAVCNLR